MTSNGQAAEPNRLQNHPFGLHFAHSIIPLKPSPERLFIGRLGRSRQSAIFDFHLLSLHCSRLLEKAHGLQASVLHRLNWELVQTSDALLRVCMSLQDWPAAASWCERTLPAYETCLPQPSALYGLQLFTLAKLKWFLEDAEGCFSSVRRACEVLSVTHGESHRLVLEAKDLCLQAQAEAGQRRSRP